MKYSIKNINTIGGVKYVVCKDDEILIRNKYYKSKQTAYVALCKYISRKEGK